MGQQALPQYREFSEDQGVQEKGELKATLTPASEECEQVSGYPVTPPVPGQVANGQCAQPVYPAQEVDEPLPCGCGLMWTIFLVGFMIGGIFTWWIGVCIGVFVSRQDAREKAGFIANLIAASVGTAIFLFVVVPAVQQMHEQDIYSEGGLQCERTCHYENYSYACETICT
eukprot:TRINITY_DN32126_c0_g1_i1.p3 TRINITY_DN32126_c0_g1~~TRINITY_DN32126_c0_g1_i1.p3  ORF type:complete len:171 (-),score=36.49 TRINITY_DN32126_c0_g1_i1:311-823(-)